MFEHINSFALKYFWLDFSGIFFAQYLAYILVAVVFLFLIYNFKRYWKMVIEAGISAVLARLIVEVIRWLWYVPRPFVENNVNLVLPYDGLAASFPSGHAAFFFALSCSVYFYNKKAGILFFIASFFIVLARVFVGIHWPLDILAGALVGVVSALFVNFLLNKLSRQQS